MTPENQDAIINLLKSINDKLSVIIKNQESEKNKDPLCALKTADQLMEEWEAKRNATTR